LKAENKKQQQEEAKKRKERFAMEQNEMLEKARQEMILENTNQVSYSPLLFPQLQKDDIINQTAEAKAKEYLSGFQSDSTNIEDIAFLYRVLLTPEDILNERMYAYNSLILGYLFRRTNYPHFIGEMPYEFILTKIITLKP
jgi:hypothetical protein